MGMAILLGHQMDLQPLLSIPQQVTLFTLTTAANGEVKKGATYVGANVIYKLHNIE